MSEPEESKPIEQQQPINQPIAEQLDDDDTPEIMLKPESNSEEGQQVSNDYDPEEQDNYDPESLSEEKPQEESKDQDEAKDEPSASIPTSTGAESAVTEAEVPETAEPNETSDLLATSEANGSEATTGPSQVSDASHSPPVLPSKPLLPQKPTAIQPQKSTEVPSQRPTKETTVKISNFASKDPNDQVFILRTSYEEIFSRETAKDPNFSGLSPVEQLKIIMPLLEERGITFNTGTKFSEVPDVNFDQVYSYNKPYRNLKDPVPLIPINELCRRPNITAPMTPEEDEAYNNFIKIEADYMRSQSWDEFPDKLRLFIGNLPANTISKQDLFRIFSQYGEIVQIAIKAGYGFAQFRTAGACLTCIKGETHVPLHNKIMRLDASKPQKSKRPTDSREFRDRDDKRSRKNIPECQIYTTGKSSVFFIRKVKRAIQNVQVTNDVEDITHRDVSEVISEAAYSGVLGTCVIKESKVDVQTFETTPDGGIKFDEYSDIEPEVAAEILQKAKVKKYGANLPSYQKPYDNQFGTNDYRGGNRRGQGNRGNRGGRDDRRGGGPGHYQRTNYDQPYPASGGYDQGPNRGYEPNYGGQYGNLYGNNQYGGNQYGNNNQYRNNQYDNQQYGNSQYDNQYGNNRYGNNQYGNSYGNNDPYGNNSQYGNNDQYGNNHYRNNQFGDPNQFTNQPAAKGPDQAQLLQTLQNMDPASMQNMLTLLQQKQQQQGSPYQQSPNQIPNQPIPNPPPANPTLQTQPSYNQPINYGQPNSSGSRQDPSNDNSKNELMETLARLSRK